MLRFKLEATAVILIDRQGEPIRGRAPLGWRSCNGTSSNQIADVLATYECRWSLAYQRHRRGAGQERGQPSPAGAVAFPLLT